MTPPLQREILVLGGLGRNPCAIGIVLFYQRCAMRVSKSNM